MSPGEVAECLRAHFSEHRPHVTHEALLQQDVEIAFRSVLPLGVCAKREHRLSPKERVDFLVGYSALWSATPMGCAVELKVDGSAAAALRQVWRYTKHDAVTGVLLVTTRAKHRLPPELDGKPVGVLCLGDYLL